MFTLKLFRRRFAPIYALTALFGFVPINLYAGSPFRIVVAQSGYDSEDIELRLAQGPRVSNSNLPPPLPIPPTTAQPLPRPSEASPSDRPSATSPNPSVPPKPTNDVEKNKKSIAAPSLRNTSISEINIDIRPKATTKNQELPEDVAQKQMQQMPVVSYGSVDDVASGLTRHTADRFAYEPLYFEEANLERYGNHCGELQPVASAVRFYATIPALPYLATLHQPREAYYWDWPYQAGRDAPRVRELPPFKLKPATVEAGAIAAFILLFP